MITGILFILSFAKQQDKHLSLVWSVKPSYALRINTEKKNFQHNIFLISYCIIQMMKKEAKTLVVAGQGKGEANYCIAIVKSELYFFTSPWQEVTLLCCSSSQLAVKMCDSSMEIRVL